MNPNHPSGEVEMQAAEMAAHSLSKKMPVLKANNERDFETAFATMVEQQVGRLSSPLTPSSGLGAARSSRWQRVMGYQRSTTYPNSLGLAA
jgi:hypothetical protein